MGYSHVLNRGVDKRSIVTSDHDRMRFVFNLYAMNNARPFEYTPYQMDIFKNGLQSDERDRLVTIHAWCLMDNHYHIVLSEKIENGIPAFLRKLNIAYTSYFNLKHKRSGVLFQGKTKRIEIIRDAHFLYILPYVHLNPLDRDATTKNWRVQDLRNPEEALAAAEEYRWSSYRNYVNEKEFVAILAGSDLFEDKRTYVSSMKKFLTTAHETELQPFSLE